LGKKERERETDIEGEIEEREGEGDIEGEIEEREGGKERERWKRGRRRIFLKDRKNLKDKKNPAFFYFTTCRVWSDAKILLTNCF
jgi:hypothetical protein